MPRETVDVLGVPVDPVSWCDLRDRVASAAQQRTRLTVMYANVHVINTAQREPGLLAALHAADIVYCDGEGVRLAARVRRQRLPARMTGADFVYDLANALAAARVKVFWLGGSPGTAELAMRELAARYPGLTIVGTQHGFFTKQGADNDAVLRAISDAGPDILFVGMGTPVQEEWVMRYRAALHVPVVWCIGATADFVAGVQPRGPDWLTQTGFEWLARLLSDPRRLFSRYVIGNPLFVARVIREHLQRKG